jgi:DNA-binding GntR family transcriptional regulator
MALRLVPSGGAAPRPAADPTAAADLALACELFDVRGMIEPVIAARAAERSIGADHLRRLYALRGAMRRAMEGPGAPDVGALLAANAAFHVVLARACGNDVLTCIVEEVFLRLDPLLGRAIDRGAGHDSPVDPSCHGDVLDAVLRGDPDHAWETARAHVASSRRAVLDALVGVGSRPER